ncbi:hypothetical protein [Actinacidiphila glaucinigra]|uniref:Uncharacterized protein n=1 Tax=Actinacidiphila glaucinigra TaxID=235986 RepID=A0A239NXJ3_9ACTN|nr:hypothetical protein [Actinacidiphila glaucinigra]SNT59128.1 hypothetical protein SAMN05216252_15321 [Actinacidiphila glaucinigra]
MSIDNWDSDGEYEAAVEQGNRIARSGMAVTAGVGCLLVAAVTVGILLVFAFMIGGFVVARY